MERRASVFAFAHAWTTIQGSLPARCGHSAQRYGPRVDMIFTELARTIVEWIDERSGRVAAWVATIGRVVVLTVGIVAPAFYLLG